jgi:hypothetical protein
MLWSMSMVISSSQGPVAPRVSSKLRGERLRDGSDSFIGHEKLNTIHSHICNSMTHLAEYGSRHTGSSQCHDMAVVEVT